MKKLCPNPYTPYPEDGYIALVSAVIISILLLAITVTLGFSGFFTRLDIFDSQSKEQSLSLAEACVDTAILTIAQDASYNPSNQFVTVGTTDQCAITSVTTLATQKIIQTQAIVNKSYTNLKVAADAATLAVESWEECAVGPCP